MSKYKNPNYKKEWYLKNRERILKQNKKRYENKKNEIIKKQEEYYQKNKEKAEKSKKEWNLRNKNKIVKYHEKERIKHRKKINARTLAKRNKPIPKGQICVECNKELATEKHHEDYDKPLEVMFVCRDCHNNLHQKTILTNEQADTLFLSGEINIKLKKELER